MKTTAVRRRHLVAILLVLVGLLGMITSAAPPSGKGDPGSGGAGSKGKVILSNTILVKLTAQARAKLNVVGEEVNPLTTGLVSLDVICRDSGVKEFRSVVASDVHRDPTAAITFWYKITLPGPEKRITLIEQTNDDALNLIYSGAEPLGRLVARLKEDPNVESVAFESVVQTLFIPNDPYYSTPYPTSKYGNIAQWAPQFIGADQAWDSTLGDPSIIIAIVDTGIDANHPDLTGKVVLAKNFVRGERVSDSFGHGTHVAGIAAAQINDGTGIAGICGRCSLMSVKVLGADGSGSLSNVVSGITYATDHGARVINLSLGSSSRSTIMRDALDYAINNNALPVVAMGNSNTSNVDDLAYWYSALSVGAVDQQGAKASFSNFGLQTDVTAPGVAVLSTMPTYPVTLNTQYGYKMNYDALSGTSMATPCVAGLAGLILSDNPSLTAMQVKTIIEDSAGDGNSFNLTYGFGAVHAPAGIALAPHTNTTNPVFSSISPTFGSTLSHNVLFFTVMSDNVGVHHVDFVSGGARFILPATSVGYAATTGVNAIPTIPPWGSFLFSTTQWNGVFNVTVNTFDKSGNSTSSAGNYDIENAYATKTFSATVCDPGTKSCPQQLWSSKFSATYPAIAKMELTWSDANIPSNYAGAIFGGVGIAGGQGFLSGVFPRYWSSTTFDYDFGQPVFCGNCNTNIIGAAIGGVYFCEGKDCPIDFSVSAGTTATVTITYPQ